MFKKILVFICVILPLLNVDARITTFGKSAVYGIVESPKEWDEINTHTWENFMSFDSVKIFGIEDKRETIAQVEFYSQGVIEGRQVGGFTTVGSFTDRGGLFGGEGYMDLYYFAPVDIDKYAQQAVFFGGWKYNLTKYIDIDIGGTFAYCTKPIVGPGIAGMGGSTTRGDIYVGFSTNKIFLEPFVNIGYEPTYDAVRFQGGFTPELSLDDIMPIDGFRIESQFIFGYISANKFSADQNLSNGSDWKNSYGFIQMEANLVYRKDWLKVFVGIGWAIHNDGKYGPDNFYMGDDNMVWAGGGIGYIF